MKVSVQYWRLYTWQAKADGCTQVVCLDRPAPRGLP